MGNEKGRFSDYLTYDEIKFSKQAGDTLKKHSSWANKMLKEGKILKALDVTPELDRSYDKLNEIKSALFEVRFAYAIHMAELQAEYEFSCGIGKKTIDFKITNSHEWLIELTSLRESSAVKENIFGDKNSFSYSSITTVSDVKNSPEIRDIIKAQTAICRKICKFPETTSNAYHMILVDMRSINIGCSDRVDYWNCAYGSKTLAHFDDGFYYREWIDQNGQKKPIKGLFDEDECIRTRIHALGFVSEKEYTGNEIFTKMKIFGNSHLFKSKSELEKIFPFQGPCIILPEF